MRAVKTSIKEESFLYIHTYTLLVIMSCKYNDVLSFCCHGFLHYPLLRQSIPPNATQDKDTQAGNPALQRIMHFSHSSFLFSSIPAFCSLVPSISMA